MTSYHLPNAALAEDGDQKRPAISQQALLSAHAGRNTFFHKLFVGFDLGKQGPRVCLRL